MKRVAFVGLLLVGLLFGCGDGDRRGSGKAPDTGPAYGQEVWITYFAPEFQRIGRRTGITKEEARRLSDDLRQRVLDGADIGELAREHSNANGAAAFGFSDWLRPPPGAQPPPDARQEVLRRTPVGGLTETIDWLGGWWFARRVPKERNEELRVLFERLGKERRKFEMVFVAWKGVWWEGRGEEEDKIPRTKEQAIQRAQEALDKALAGMDFHDVVREYSDEPKSRERQGLHMVEEVDKTWTEWVRAQEPTLPKTLLDALFSAEVGKVHPKVIVTEWGAFVIKVLAKRP